MGAGGKGRRGHSSNYCSQVSEEHQEFLGNLLGEGRGERGRAEASLGLKDVGVHFLPGTPLRFCTRCLRPKVDPVAGSLVHDKTVLGILQFVISSPLPLASHA